MGLISAIKFVASLVRRFKMTEGSGLSPLQFTLLTGTFLIANLAAFWLIRRNFFSSSRPAAAKKKEKNEILDEEEWREFELIRKEEITHNTAIYRFKLPTPESVLPLPIGQVSNEAKNMINNVFYPPFLSLGFFSTYNWLQFGMIKKLSAVTRQ